MWRDGYVAASRRSSQAFAYRWAPSSILLGGPTAQCAGWSTMEYNKQFIVEAFEREPGKWRASVRRADGKPVRIIARTRTKLDKFVTGVDATTAEAALRMAIAAIDAGAFSR